RRRRDRKDEGLCRLLRRVVDGAAADRGRDDREHAPLQVDPRHNPPGGISMSTFVKQPDVEQEQFDWGTIGWRCRPANTGAKQLVVMDVTLEPREGHAFHRHDGQEEMIIVKQGAVTQFIERDSTTLNAGDSVYLDAG